MLTMLCGAWQGPAYSRHTLPGETEPVEQAQEILILQRRSLRVDASGSDRISPRKEVRRGDVPAAAVHVLLSEGLQVSQEQGRGLFPALL